MSLIDELPHTVDHTRPKYDRDAGGGNVQRDGTIASGVAAWVQNASMAEVREFQKQDQTVTHKVFFGTNPGLRPGDNLDVASGPSYVGVSLAFVAAADRSAGLGLLWAAMCREENNPRRART